MVDTNIPIKADLLQEKYKQKRSIPNALQVLIIGGVVKWLKRRISNLRIASYMSSNPVRDKPLFL